MYHQNFMSVVVYVSNRNLYTLITSSRELTYSQLRGLSCVEQLTKKTITDELNACH